MQLIRKATENGNYIVEEDTAKARCLSDNLCYEPAKAGDGLYCVVEKRLDRGIKRKST